MESTASARDEFGDKKLVIIALCIFISDQVTKLIVVRTLAYQESFNVIDGFFRFVHWHNTGAAWSLFRGWNGVLALISLGAVALLYLNRRHFGSESVWGQVSLGLLFGGIIGNLTDRLRLGYVIDFLYFHVHPRQGGELGFPAFNVADSSICIGVALLFYRSWTVEEDSLATEGKQQSR